MKFIKKIFKDAEKHYYIAPGDPYYKVYLLMILDAVILLAIFIFMSYLLGEQPGGYRVISPL